MDLMLPALVISLILVSIHAYLGIHIIARGVIFVDLALAQVAALGWAAAGLGLSTTLGNWLGLPASVTGYAIGLLATLLAATLFSVSRMEHYYVPQEAIIGIVYVVASAGTILLAAQAPRGAEHVEELLSGSLLWVTWPEKLWPPATWFEYQIPRTAIIYAAIGSIYWFLRERFMWISMNPVKARLQGWSVAAWDFLFYALFGVVVTISVPIAGVLVVFSFLVIPAVIAFLFTAKPDKLLAIAWSSGTLATLLGLYASYETDFPTGPTVVCAFAATLVLAFALNRLLRRREATPETV
ncbi:MAG: metal ABC transporter permease [Gemmatimonadales bacterium]|nr:metal ABC transporter permease [Gemmatimonadales bacterium]